MEVIHNRCIVRSNLTLYRSIKMPSKVEVESSSNDERGGLREFSI